MGKKYFADGRYYEGEFQNGKIVNEQNIVMRNIKEENNLIDNGLEFTNNISLNNKENLIDEKMSMNKENINNNMIILKII